MRPGTDPHDCPEPCASLGTDLQHKTGDLGPGETIPAASVEAEYAVKTPLVFALAITALALVLGCSDPTPRP